MSKPVAIITFVKEDNKIQPVCPRCNQTMLSCFEGSICGDLNEIFELSCNTIGCDFELMFEGI